MLYQNEQQRFRMAKKRKKRIPLKECPACQSKVHARKAECEECGHCFYEKKSNLVTDWTKLKKGDIVRSLYGNGPYWEDPVSKEKLYMGSYGKFAVNKIGENYIECSEVKKYGGFSSGYHVLYMGEFKRSNLCDNLYRCPHKLIIVSLKGESK